MTVVTQVKHVLQGVTQYLKFGWRNLLTEYEYTLKTGSINFDHNRSRNRRNFSLVSEKEEKQLFLWESKATRCYLLRDE